ncbi:MmcQ/YjbR family DNA-binding protein [Basilea psittacipulmonis]|uniref:MmcQ/YjbR family DNA-binding protein n=1 Tax=Basilea psittacipulmonis TaxID=1472345 RepID=UPI00068A7678|nr:MmcQ/YjbR family DNA-binding protein [Basilea psittacipulmonis]
MQTFEQEFFTHKRVNWQSLIPFGFKLHQGIYEYREQLMKHPFEAIIQIDPNGVLTGKVWDTEMQTEYINFRLPQQVGAFVAEIRQAYSEILKKIAEHCFTEQYGTSLQSQRITAKLPAPDHPFKKYPEFVAFRSPVNQKWYGLLMTITYEQLDFTAKATPIHDRSQKVDVLNVKVNPDLIPKCFKQAGVYPSYHMNKKHWVSLTLDDQLSDEEVFEWLAESKKMVES